MRHNLIFAYKNYDVINRNLIVLDKKVYKIVLVFQSYPSDELMMFQNALMIDLHKLGWNIYQPTKSKRTNASPQKKFYIKANRNNKMLKHLWH